VLRLLQYAFKCMHEDVVTLESAEHTVRHGRSTMAATRRIAGVLDGIPAATHHL